MTQFAVVPDRERYNHSGRVEADAGRRGACLADPQLMDRLIPLALLPGHPDHPARLAALARWLIYVRAHWLRMSPGLLIKHLSHKAWLRLRGFRTRVDLGQLDLKQQ